MEPGLLIPRFLACAILACAGPGLGAGVAAAADTPPRELVILGWVENVLLTEPGFRLRAKLDSGAQTSSLDARILKRFRRNGKRWVRFAVTNPKTGEEHILVRERVRTIGVVQHEGVNQVRPTVMLQICIADRLLDVEVSLIDRSAFSYTLLLGRSALGAFALIDPASTFLSRPQCKIPKKAADKPS